MSTFDFAICDKAHGTAGARTTGRLEVARDHMASNPFFVEIPRTHLGPTLRSELLRSPHSVSRT